MPAEERDDIPQPTEWDRRPDEGWGPIKVLALVVAILLVVLMVARFA